MYSNGYGTNCDPLVADLFLFCYERDFMLSLSDNTQTNTIEASTTDTHRENSSATRHIITYILW